jgi:tetratricopeptide (TPR) repeat protein
MENRVFSTAASKKISDTYIAVRLLGGDDITPEIESVMTRYGVDGYPTMLVVDQEGLRLNEEEVGRTTDDILAAMDAGKATGEKLAAAAKGDQAAYLELLKQHDGWEKLVDVYEKSAAAAPTAENHVNLHEALGRMGRKEDAAKLLDTMIAKHTKHEQRPSWRTSKVLELVAVVSTLEEANEKFPKAIDGLTALIATADEEKDSATSLAAHLELGNLFLNTDRFLSRGSEARAHYEQVIEKGAETKYAASALMGMASVHFLAKDYESALAALEKIVESHPKSDEAKQAPRLIQIVKQRIVK